MPEEHVLLLKRSDSEPVSPQAAQAPERQPAGLRLRKVLVLILLLGATWHAAKLVQKRLQQHGPKRFHMHSRSKWPTALFPEAQQRLLQQFCPVVRLDSLEPVRPMALEDYIRQSSLRLMNNDSLLQPSQRLSLRQFRGRRGRGTYLSYEGVIEPPTADVEDVPFYARVDERQYRGRPAFVLLYMFWWPYNAPYEPLPGKRIGAHVGDLEHVRVVVDAATRRIVDVYYGAHSHSDGVWLGPDQLLYHDSEKQRILVFPGKGSHANYERPGEHERLLGLADDHNDSAGFYWNRQAALVAPLPHAVLHYGGRLSRHVVNAWQQAWWQQETAPTYSRLPLTSWLALRTVYKGRRLLRNS